MKKHNMEVGDLNTHGTMGHMDMMTMVMPEPWFKAFTKGPFLFELWMTDTISGLVAAMMLSMFLAILYECMNYTFNIYHLRAERWHTRQNRIIAHVMLSLLRTVSIVIAYVIMLGVMSYNLWILLSVIVGSGFGHLVGRPLVSIAVKKKAKEKFDGRATNTLLHDFKPLNDHPEEKQHRQAVTNSLNLNSFETKLLSYNFEDNDT